MNPQPPDNPAIPDAIELAWWKSRKFVAAMVHHALVWSGVVVGGILNRQSLSVSIPAAIGSSTAVTVGQNAAQASVDRAQANSPNYPLPPHMGGPPNVPPASGSNLPSPPPG